MKTNKEVLAGMCFGLLCLSLTLSSELNLIPFDKGVAFAQINALLAITSFLRDIARKLDKQ